MRDNTNRSWPLGGERFKDAIEQALAQAARPPKRGRPFKSKNTEEAKTQREMSR